MSTKAKAKATTKAKPAKAKSTEGRLKKNPQLLPSRTYTLDGAERQFVIRALERIKPQERSQFERNLLTKFRA